MKSRFAIAISLSLLAVLAAVLMHFGFRQKSERGDMAPVMPATAAFKPNARSAPAPEVAVGGQAVPMPQRQAVDKAPMLKSFSGKGDARSFVLEAWQRPDLGGRTYATAVTRRCSGLRELGPENDSEVAARVGEADVTQAMEAFKFLQMRCGQFSDDELSRYSANALIAAQDGRQDALSQLSNKLSRSAGSPEERLSALKAVLDSRDPMLLDNVGPRIALHRDSEGAYLWFRGRRYPVREDPPLLGAFYLVPCAFGMPCGDTDMELARQCVSGAGCYKDRFERARAEVGNDPERYRALIRAYEDLVAAINAGDVDAFTARP
jgi:hypothetical protein